MSANPYAGFGRYTGLVMAMGNRIRGEAEADRLRAQQEQLARQEQLRAASFLAEQENIRHNQNLKIASLLQGAREADVNFRLRQEQSDLAREQFDWTKGVKERMLALKENAPAKEKTLTPYQEEQLRQQRTDWEAEMEEQDRLEEVVHKTEPVLGTRTIDVPWQWSDRTEEYDTGNIKIDDKTVSRAAAIRKIGINRARLRKLLGYDQDAPQTESASNGITATTAKPTGQITQKQAPTEVDTKREIDDNRIANLVEIVRSGGHLTAKQWEILKEYRRKLR